MTNPSSLTPSTGTNNNVSTPPSSLTANTSPRPSVQDLLERMRNQENKIEATAKTSGDLLIGAHAHLRRRSLDTGRVQAPPAKKRKSSDEALEENPNNTTEPPLDSTSELNVADSSNNATGAPLDSTNDLHATTKPKAHTNKGSRLLEVTYPLETEHSEKYLPSDSFLEKYCKHDEFQLAHKETRTKWKTSTKTEWNSLTNLQSTYTHHGTPDSWNATEIEQGVRFSSKMDRPKEAIKANDILRKRRLSVRESKVPTLESLNLCLQKRPPTKEEKQNCPYAEGLAELFDGSSLTLVNIHVPGSTAYNDAKLPHFDFGYVLCHICGKNPTHAIMAHSTDYVPIKTKFYQDPYSDNLTDAERKARHDNNRKHAEKTVRLFKLINKIQYEFHSTEGYFLFEIDSVPDYQLELANKLFQTYNSTQTETTRLDTQKFIETTNKQESGTHYKICCIEHKTFPLFFLAQVQDLLDHLSLAVNYPQCMQPYTDCGGGCPKTYVSEVLLTHLAYEQMINCFFMKIRTKYNNTQHTDLPISTYLGHEQSKKMNKVVPNSFKEAKAEAGNQCTARMSFMMHFFKSHFSHRESVIYMPKDENYKSNSFQDFVYEATINRDGNLKKFPRGILSTTHLVGQHHNNTLKLKKVISLHCKSLTLPQWRTALKYKKHYIQLSPNSKIHYFSEHEKNNDETCKDLMKILHNKIYNHIQFILLKQKQKKERSCECLKWNIVSFLSSKKLPKQDKIRNQRSNTKAPSNPITINKRATKPVEKDGMSAETERTVKKDKNTGQDINVRLVSDKNGDDIFASI